MINLSVTHDLGKAIRWANEIAEDQVPFALAHCLTLTGLDVKRAETEELAEKLDRPTRWTMNAVFLRRATPARLEAVVWLKDSGDTASRAYLQTQVEGGQRVAKRFEKALQRVGLMPNGYVAVPGAAAPLDAHGNVPGKFIVQILSYLSAFSEVGYKANMSDKRKKRLADVGRNESGSTRINGVQYFVSRGQGEWRGARSWSRGKQQHLPAGIWAKTGTHGVDIKPVFLFVPAARYRRRVDFHGVAGRVQADRLMINWHKAWRGALLSMRSR